MWSDGSSENHLPEERGNLSETMMKIMKNFPERSRKFLQGKSNELGCNKIPHPKGVMCGKSHQPMQQEMFTCHHCGKQLRSLAGMKYHIMADHNNLPVVKEGGELDEQCERDRLRKVLKRMGKLKCMREGCTGSFTSIMGYLYHMKKCGKAASELEKMAMKCRHCGKAYKSKAGLVYHLRSEHGPVTFLHEEGRPESLKEMTLEPSSAGRVQRKSAKVAVYYLHELANEELAKEWPKKKVLQDLVPDDRKLKYTRPGLPTFSQDVLCKWKSEIKMYRRVHCPNQGCESVYGSVSGLKSHLGTCTLGDFVAGKYKCLLCEKEFISESGVKYHINSVHAEDWFDVSTTNKKSFEKLMKIRQREDEQRKQRKKRIAARSRKKRPGTVSAKKLLGAGAERSRRRIPCLSWLFSLLDEDSVSRIRHSRVPFMSHCNESFHVSQSCWC
ncbi:zinc finger protein 512 isoform X5 [Chelonoidis abingdonii]|uniref:zinc finger protein 512 isoform X5 n=2 Tax=Chelonoidis abingdonii TaxID=106734 RepID=UPI003F493B66